MSAKRRFENHSNFKQYVDITRVQINRMFGSQFLQSSSTKKQWPLNRSSTILKYGNLVQFTYLQQPSFIWCCLCYIFIIKTDFWKDWNPNVHKCSVNNTWFINSDLVPHISVSNLEYKWNCELRYKCNGDCMENKCYSVKHGSCHSE